MFTVPLSVESYQQAHYSLLSELLARPDRSHVHVDWQTVLDWFGESGVIGCLAWREKRPVGVMAVSPPQEGVSWLRVVALTDGISISSTVRKLWACLLPPMIAAGVRRVVFLQQNNWLPRVLASLDFIYIDDVISLKRTGQSLRHQAGISAGHDSLVVRPVTQADLPSILAVDHAAFDPVWRMSLPDFRAAMSEAASFSMAELDGEPVGYELTVTNGAAVHLARLATVPEMQGRGVGSSLLHGALERLTVCGYPVMTVNTQASNGVSQHLYRRFGFVMTGMDVRVWEAQIDDTE